MQLKPGVKVAGVQPETVLAMAIAASVFDRHGKDICFTSVCEGKHGEKSLHYSGKAFDIRTTSAGIGDPVAQVFAEKLRTALGADYDVVVESDHIHCEFDPK